MRHIAKSLRRSYTGSEFNFWKGELNHTYTRVEYARTVSLYGVRNFQVHELSIMGSRIDVRIIGGEMVCVIE